MTPVQNKKNFTVKVDDQELKLAVVRPSVKDKQNAQLEYARRFKEAITSGAILRAKVEAVMRQQNLWDDDKQGEWEKLTTALAEGEKKLTGGGMRKSDGIELAFKMKKDRRELGNLNAHRAQLDQHTAEAMAEQARFDYLLVQCVREAETGRKYYSGLEDYQSRENDPVAAEAGNILSRWEYQVEEGWEKKFPENKFLMAAGALNDKLQRVNKDGHLVDDEGRLITAEGWYVNSQGERIDREGNKLDGDGNYLVDFKPFLDDDGNPIEGFNPLKPEQSPAVSEPAKTEKAEKVKEQSEAA